MATTAETLGVTVGEPVLVPGDASARIIGYLIDTVILSIGSLVLLVLLGLVHGSVLEVRTSGGLADRVEIDSVRFAIDTIVITLFAAAYFAGSWVRFGATLGQRSVGLRVLPVAAARVSPAAATIRFLSLGSPLWVAAGLTSGNVRLACWLLTLIWYAVVLVSVANGTSTSGLHDRLAGTIVVRQVVPCEEPAEPAAG